MLVHSLTYTYLCMVFYRSKGINSLWINSHYILVSASRKIKFTDSLVIIFFGTGKIQKQNSKLVQMNTTSLISILSVWLVSVYGRAKFYLCNQKHLKIKWCEVLDVLMSVKKRPLQPADNFSGVRICSPAAWWEWVIHTGSAGPCWGWEAAWLWTMAFSRE